MSYEFMYQYDDLDFLKSQTYYHGTSDIFNLKELRPAYETTIDRENKKSKKVWITTNKGSAERYAYKAVDKFGGNPIIYEVEPDWNSLAHRIDFEYICDFAEIRKEI